MKNFHILPDSNLPNKIASEVSKQYTGMTKMASMERKAAIIERFKKGEKLTSSEVTDAEIPLKHYGFNVYEDEMGRTWWKEDDVIYRPDDSSIYTAIEQYLNSQKINPNK